MKNNKLIIIIISLLVFTVISIFTLFSSISTAMKNSYNQLVDEGNLHNIVIYENWSKNSSVANANKTDFYNALDDLKIHYRNYNSLNVTNSTNNSTTKIIEYQNYYSVDKLVIYEQHGLPISNDLATLPSGFYFNDIINTAASDINNVNVKTNKDIIFARQLIVWFGANADWNNSNFETDFKNALDAIYVDPNIDPLYPNTSTKFSSSINNSLTKVSSYLRSFLDNTLEDYYPLVVKGSRLTFDMIKFNNNIPVYGYFEDPSSYVGIATPNWIEENKKEIYSFDEYTNFLGYSNGYINNPTKITDLPKQIASNQQIHDLINNLDDKYIINVNNIPYIIVGSGISPDMMFPIISFANLVPDNKNEAILYTNYSGYQKAEWSYGSMEHENFLVCKYTGSLNQAEIIAILNSYVEKYMAWPSNVEAVYWYNSEDNTMSPTAYRVNFIIQLLDTINIVSILISLFVFLILIFIMCLFARMYITNNKNTIAILISNGLSKNKIIFSLSLIAFYICGIVAPLGYILGTLLQPILFNIFKVYWMIPVSFIPLNIGWIILLTFIPILIFLVVLFISSKWLLKSNVVQLLKENQNITLNLTARIARNMFSWSSIMVKFRGSLAFNSVIKIIFLTTATATCGVAGVFLSSFVNKIQSIYNNEITTNNSEYSINLFTSTIQGGQYYGVDTNKTGFTIIGKDTIIENNYKNGLYADAYNSSPIFAAYSLIHYPDANDQKKYSTDILFLKNLTEIYPFLDIDFGIGSLTSNPFDIPKAIAPVNQVNMLYNSAVEYTNRAMSDMRPYNQAYLFKFNNSTPGKNYINPSNSNSYSFPNQWAIMNFNNSDPTTWELNYNLDQNVGVISAPEINGLNSIEDVLTMTGDQLADIINESYNTYSVDNQDDDLISNPDLMYRNKYYPNLFSHGSINNIRIDNNNPNVVLFDCDTTNNETKELITNRSLFTKKFYRPVSINDDNIDLVNLGKIYIDPFNVENNVGYQLIKTEAVGILGLNLLTPYINFVLKNYYDPAYKNTWARIEYNEIILDDNQNEPFVHIDGLIQNDNLRHDQIDIIGIKENSQFIHLFNNKKKPINDLLFKNENPLIINNYAAEKYKLKIGDELIIYPENNVYRYSISNAEELINDVNSEPKFNSNINNVNFKIVEINNTGNHSQFYTSIFTAQNALGLATENDYLNNTNISKITSDTNNSSYIELDVGMNNQVNSFGGFNGIFTNNRQPKVLTSNVSLYSPSGLYIPNDTLSNNEIIVKLIKSSLSNSTYMAYIANALSLTSSELYQICNNFKNNQAKINPALTDDQLNTELAQNIINALITIYGNVIYNSVVETANSVILTKTMFDKTSTLYNQISIIIGILIIFLSLIVIIICSNMIITDMINLFGILKTLGYNNKQNGLNFAAIFIPCWLLNIIISAPLSYLFVHLFNIFTFLKLQVYLGAVVNWLAFGLIELVIGLMFVLIYLWSIKHFQKINLLDVLKW